jgi:hypothetical protein
MSCQHECERPPVFPRKILNRPGLGAIAYRIGTYADMRGYMLARLDAEPALASFTHRKGDDPAIALLESAAIVGDILSFYQQLYANEAYLRTAQWGESVADLVKLLGYRLAPGLGGHARFALIANGSAPVIVSQGFGFKAQLDGSPKPANFETTAPVTAYPGLSEFHLYRPRYTPSIVNGIDTFVVSGAGDAVSLKAGDKLMVGVARVDDGSLDHSQIVVVDKTWVSFETRYVKTKGAITCLDSLFTIFAPALFQTIFPTGRSATSGASAPFSLSASVMNWMNSAAIQATGTVGAVSTSAGAAEQIIATAGELRAYKITGSFRHFGHNAPATQVTVDQNGHSQQQLVSYWRSLDSATSQPASPDVLASHLPLDGDVSSITAGTTLLTEAPLDFYAPGAFLMARFSTHRRVVERKIAAVDHQWLAWGGQTGGCTMLTIDRTLALQEGGATANYADIRNMTFHQVEGDSFSLMAPPQSTAAASGSELLFYGSADAAAALAGRTVLLVGPGTAVAEALIAAADSTVTTSAPAFHRLNLNHTVEYANFDYEQPTVTVYGNLVAATEGKSQDEVILGDGDARQTFQTFPVPKPPLTYLLAPASDPPQAPELSVYVGGRRWTRVDSFFTSAPRNQVYVVREDAGNQSYVQFGDGKTGARLPTGRGNVTGQFRTGSGSHGALKAGAKPQADRLAGLDKAYMPEPVSGGAAPEDAESARIAAPGRMQSLARLVSLADIEAEAQAIAGVLRATAAWDISTGHPRVNVTIFTLSRSAVDAQSVADTLLAFYQARGPARYSLSVVPGKRRQLRIAANVAYDASHRGNDVEVGIVTALGAVSADGSESPKGLFSWQRRRFGEGAHGSQIVAAIQNVPGVLRVDLTGASIKNVPSLSLMRRLRFGSASAEWLSFGCPADTMLALDAIDLALSLSPARVSEV